MQLSKKEQVRIKDKYGPWAVITGATSGIGREIAGQLASAGLNLVVSSRSQPRLNKLMRELTTDQDIEVRMVVGDLAEEQQVTELIEATQGLPISLLVVSAGFGTSGIFTASDVNVEVNMLRLNGEALLRLTHYFGRQFAKQERGGIILMSSMVAFQGVPNSAHYAATKAYVQTLAEGIHHELKPYGVDVLAAAPGPVATSFAERADLQMDMAQSPENIGVPVLRALGKRTTVLPGNLTKLLVYSLRTVPRWAKTRIMQKVMGGMTAHQL